MQEVQAQFDMPVIAVATLTDLIGYLGDSPIWPPTCRPSGLLATPMASHRKGNAHDDPLPGRDWPDARQPAEYAGHRRRHPVLRERRRASGVAMPRPATAGLSPVARMARSSNRSPRQ